MHEERKMRSILSVQMLTKVTSFGRKALKMGKKGMIKENREKGTIWQPDADKSKSSQRERNEHSE
jgi:hypothetical protein